MNKPRQIRVEIAIPFGSFSYESVPTLLRIYNEALNKVPKEFRDTVVSELEPHNNYGTPSVKLNMHYCRPETEEEIARRVQAEEARKDFDKENKYKTYLKLKKEFENG